MSYYEQCLSITRLQFRLGTLEMGAGFGYIRPNSGVFLQVTCDDAVDLPVPGQKYTFGVVKAAQARCDFQVLAERDRRVLRIHFGKEVREGLQALERGITQALA